MINLKTLLKQGRYITEINNEIFDITDFVRFHPGGNIILSVANGNSGTAMYYSSHFNLPDIENTPGIKKIELDKGEIITCPLNFNYNESSFYFTLKRDIQAYFAKKNIDYRVPTPFARLCFWINISLFFLFYYLSYIQGYIFFSVLMGILSWNFAGTLVHDGEAHQTVLGKHNHIGNVTISFLSSFCFPLAFGSHFSLSHAMHHSAIHDAELDSDENLLYPLMRLHPDRPKLWFHKYQHLYWPFAFAVYLFSYIRQTFRDRKNNWWKRHNHLYRPTKSLKFKLLVLSFLIFHITIPIYYNGFFHGIISYFIFLFSYSVGGLFFAIVSHYIVDEKITNHVNRNDWDYHTVTKSGDYLVHSRFAHWISGGFSVHGLHHLFPSIHPSHLSSIYHLYERRCEEYHYPYVRIESWSEVMRLFLHNIYILGNI